MVSDKPLPELSEKDFIQNNYKKKPWIFWFFLVVFLLILFFLWAMSTWQEKYLYEIKRDNPFLKVTNRQFSLFLWQNPEFMRVNSKTKMKYLHGFRSLDNVHLVPELAEEYVMAPLDVIFRYHVWKRLIGNWVAARPIMSKEFSEFLKDCPEWQPEIWKRHHITTGEFTVPSTGYFSLVERLPEMEDVNLEPLPYESLPLDVRMAFQGWKNYFKEGDKINSVDPTFEQMNSFLKNYPHYARSYWRNILIKNQPQYLESYLEQINDQESKIPKKQLSSFLKVGFYNFSLAEQENQSSTTTNPSE